MQQLRELAARLLAEGTVQAVVGYEEGPRGVRPAFITRAEDAARLIFDRRCVHNLAAYLNPRRKHIVALGKLAVVVKGCDARAVAGLIREHQIEREAVVLLAVRCGGVLEDPTSDAALTAATTAPRCAHCDAREPHLYDYLLGDPLPAPPANPRRDQQLATLAAMSVDERRQFWDAHLDRCIRCYACREACPMCFCVRCEADCATPQWIDPSPTPAANRAWTTMRVLHQAGRCVDCQECERACPEQIPLGLLARFVADSVRTRFAYEASDDPTQPAPLGIYRRDDDEEFIR